MKFVLVIVGIVVLAAVMYSQSAFTIAPGNTLSSCPAPSSKALIFCNVAGDPAHPDGAYLSANGGTYFLVGSQTQGGVSTVFGRTGNIAASQGDYSFSQLSNPPTTLNCASWSLTQGGSLAASGCQIK